MNELAVKIAELLDITVESAINLYPVLREQFIVYKITGMLRAFTVLTIITITIYSMAIWAVGYEVEDYLVHSKFETLEEQKEHNKKITEKIKGKMLFILISIVFLVVILIIRYVFATDLMMLLEFM